MVFFLFETNKSFIPFHKILRRFNKLTSWSQYYYGTYFNFKLIKNTANVIES
jgi:hypothetical protein